MVVALRFGYLWWFGGCGLVDFAISGVRTWFWVVFDLVLLGWALGFVFFGWFGFWSCIRPVGPLVGVCLLCGVFCGFKCR